MMAIGSVCSPCLFTRLNQKNLRIKVRNNFPEFLRTNRCGGDFSRPGRMNSPLHDFIDKPESYF
jgi:hypothetical protein